MRLSVLYTVNKNPRMDRIEIKIDGVSVLYEEIDQLRLRFEKIHGVKSGCYNVLYLERDEHEKS